MWVCVNLVVGYKLTGNSKILAEESVYLICLDDGYKLFDQRISEIDNILKSELFTRSQSINITHPYGVTEIEPSAIKYGYRKITVTNLSFESDEDYLRISSSQFIFEKINDFELYIGDDCGVFQRDTIPALINSSDIM